MNKLATKVFSSVSDRNISWVPLSLSKTFNEWFYDRTKVDETVLKHFSFSTFLNQFSHGILSVHLLEGKSPIILSSFSTYRNL